MSTFQKYDSTTLYTGFLASSLEDTASSGQCYTSSFNGNKVYIGLQNDNNEFIGNCNLSSFNSTYIDCEEGDDWKLIIEDIDDNNTAANLMYSGSVPPLSTTRTFNIKSISGKELFVTLNINVLSALTPTDDKSVYINMFMLTSATDIYLITTNHGETVDWPGGYIMISWQPTSAMKALAGHNGPIGLYYTTTSDTSDIEGNNLLTLLNRSLTYKSGTQYGPGSINSGNFAIFNIAGHVYKDFNNSDKTVTDTTTIYVYYHRNINLEVSNELQLAGSFTRKSGGCYTLTKNS